MSRLAAICLATLATLNVAACRNQKSSSITQEELVRRTQELLDSVARGDREPWRKYFAPDAMFFDEKGRNMDKTALVNDVSPLPPGYSGTIKLVRPQSRILGDTAILSYDLDETENVFGQNLTARYHETDTWMNRNAEWQIVSGQVLRYYEDPMPRRPNPEKFPEYAGTYELAPGKTLIVFPENNDLYSQKTGKAKELLITEGPDIFFRKGIEGRIVFRRAPNGKVDALLDRRNNEDIVWKRTGN